MIFLCMQCICILEDCSADIHLEWSCSISHRSAKLKHANSASASFTDPDYHYCRITECYFSSGSPRWMVLAYRRDEVPFATALEGIRVHMVDWCSLLNLTLPLRDAFTRVVFLFCSASRSSSPCLPMRYHTWLRLSLHLPRCAAATKWSCHTWDTERAHNAFISNNN